MVIARAYAKYVACARVYPRVHVRKCWGCARGSALVRLTYLGNSWHGCSSGQHFATVPTLATYAKSWQQFACCDNAVRCARTPRTLNESLKSIQDNGTCFQMQRKKKEDRMSGGGDVNLIFQEIPTYLCGKRKGKSLIRI